VSVSSAGFCLHESGYDVRGGPTEDEASLRGLAGLRHVLYVTRREPELAHSHRLLQLEVAAAASFRDEQQIGKEKEMSLLGLHALKWAKQFRNR